MKQKSSSIDARALLLSGATVKPQLPMMAVVVPWAGIGSHDGSHHIEPSKCV
jgi:hypothetical protein